MENNKKYWFFGSKLNTALLLILIILMIIALRWMYKDRDKYTEVFNDGMNSKDAEYWDNLTVENPKLNEILGYDGKPLNQSVVEGNKEDLVSFSIKPGQDVSGKVSFTGAIKGGYFFEGNFGLGALDSDKKDFKIVYDVTKEATSDWMTSGPVSIEGSIDFTNLPKGKAYIAITADDPRDASERGDSKIKKILIPVIIK